MDRKLSNKVVSAFVIMCLTVTGILIPTTLDNSVYAAAAKASLSKCTITVPSENIANKKFTMTLKGDRQSAKGSTEGETRYIPYSYVIIHSDGKIFSPEGLKPNKSGKYSYQLNFTVPGTKVAEVTWNHQKYVNGKWKTTSKKETTKNIVVKGTIKYNPNGGTITTKSKTLKHNTKIGTLPTPKWTAYTFKGWYTSKSGGKKIGKTSTIKFTTATMTLYARWAPIKGSSRVTLHPNRGSVSTKSIMVIKGKKYNHLNSLPDARRAKYNFAGWYTAKLGGTKVNNSTTVTKSTAHTLYARWKNNYKVTFNANGGIVPTGSKTVILTKAYGALPTPTKNNSKFLGWYNALSGGKKITSKSTVIIKANQTLYARWQSTKTIISKYDSTSKKLIGEIGKQAPSQCAAYCMLYCTAIKDKIRVQPSRYLYGNLAVWSNGGMTKKTYTSSFATTNHQNAFAEVKRQIDKGLPCIIRTTYNNGSGQHWLVVVGHVANATTYSDLYVLDPAASSPSSMKLFYDTKYYFPQSGEVAVAVYY